MDVYINEVSRQLSSCRSASKTIGDPSVFGKPNHTYSLIYPFCGEKQNFVFDVDEICKIIQERNIKPKAVPISYFHGIYDKKGPYVYNPLDQGAEDISYDPDKVITTVQFGIIEKATYLVVDGIEQILAAIKAGVESIQVYAIPYTWRK